MNLRQLEVFQAVLQTGSMSAAARLLCVTPSAVSKAVAHTELQLGYALFTRSPAGLTPTPEAQVLATESAGIHRQLEGLRQTARNLARGEGGRSFGGQMRAALGVEGWVSDTVTMGFSGMYRLNAIRDLQKGWVVGHAMQGVFEIGFHW